jgi:hypothetical protein
MVCRRDFSSAILSYRQGCRSIVLFRCFCIIRPVGFLSGFRQSVALEHWHRVLFQVADSVPSLVPNPERGLVSNLAQSLVPNLCLWAASAGSFGHYLPV